MFYNIENKMQLHIPSIYVSELCVHVQVLALVSKSSQSVLAIHLLVKSTAIHIQVAVNELEQMGRRNWKSVPEMGPSEFLRE